MNVLIVSRTRMSGENRCIGGLMLDSFRSIRLLNESGKNWTKDAPFQVGEVWDLTFSNANQTLKPHTEDVYVQTGRLQEKVSNISSFLRDNQEPLAADGRFWIGPPLAMFGRAIKFTGNGSGYIDESNIPNVSTGFWVPDINLSFAEDEGKVRFHYAKLFSNVRIPYVGDGEPPRIIPQGTICRLSLARWWSPEPDQPKRCYLQLSGAYLPTVEDKSPFRSNGDSATTI